MSSYSVAREEKKELIFKDLQEEYRYFLLISQLFTKRISQASAFIHLFMRCLFTWGSHHKAKISKSHSVCWGCIIIRLRARISGGLLITPLVGEAGSGQKMADGYFDFTFQGLVIQRTLRALLPNNRKPPGRIASTTE